MYITPYKAMYFPNFIFLRKRLKSSHTSLKKLEKEDFNSINRYFISSLVPASALPSWGSMPQLGNKKMYCICLSRHRALTSKCRRGDASPPGEDALPAGEDALLTRAYVRVHNIYLETFFVPCFIFITQCIDNQYFQEMKHWHSMFHF